MIRRGAELLPTGECADVAVPDDHIVGVSALDAAVAAITAQCQAAPPAPRRRNARVLVHYGCGHDVSEQRCGGGRSAWVTRHCPTCASGATRPVARATREEQRLAIGAAEHLRDARAAMGEGQ